MLAQFESKQANQRTQWIADQIKFREELSEAVRSLGNKAGPDIDKLAKRYGTEVDPVRWAKAHQAWRYSRVLTQQAAKVKYIRELELPEVVILDFLSDDLHTQVKKRGGPRNESEVRARAAQLLLERYPFPGADPSPTASEPAQAQAPGNGADRP